VRGIYHYKSRFRPHYREMFLATNPKITCRSLVSTLALWKLLAFNPLHLTRNIRELPGRITQGRALSDPSRRPSRVIRELRPGDIALPETAKETGIGQ